MSMKMSNENVVLEIKSDNKTGTEDLLISVPYEGMKALVINNEPEEAEALFVNACKVVFLTYIENHLNSFFRDIVPDELLDEMDEMLDELNHIRGENIC